MRFDVGAWVHRAGIASEPIMEDGRALMGKYERAKRSVLISPECAPEARLEVLLHEFRHAWLIHANGGNLPDSIEADCDGVATFTATMMRWLHINGGQAALIKLQPGEFLQPGAAKMALRQSRRCAVCDTVITGGAIEFCPDPENHSQAILLAYCESCNHVQSWRETVDVMGRPNGDPQGEPEIRKGKAVEQFLRRHPECGVVFQD